MHHMFAYQSDSSLTGLITGYSGDPPAAAAANGGIMKGTALPFAYTYTNQRVSTCLAPPPTCST